MVEESTVGPDNLKQILRNVNILDYVKNYDNSLIIKIMSNDSVNELFFE